MAKRFYPAVLERDPSGVFGVWFPDFPGAVAGGRTQEEAVARAQSALELAMQELAERDLPLPASTGFDAIRPPEDADVVTILALAATPPDPSERVNIYLPKSVIERADEQAASLGRQPFEPVWLGLDPTSGVRPVGDPTGGDDPAKEKGAAPVRTPPLFL